MKTEIPQTYTPPQLAKRWKVSPDKICTLIRSGKLKAFDVSLGSKRPRFKVTAEAVRDFEEMRMVQSKPKTTRRPRHRDSAIIEFF